MDGRNDLSSRAETPVSRRKSPLRWASRCMNPPQRREIRRVLQQDRHRVDYVGESCQPTDPQEGVAGLGQMITTNADIAQDLTQSRSRPRGTARISMSRPESWITCPMLLPKSARARGEIMGDRAFRRVGLIFPTMRNACVRHRRARSLPVHPKRTSLLVEGAAMTRAVARRRFQ